MEMSSGLTLVPTPTWKSDALSLYQRLLPAAFLDPLEKQPRHRQNNRVYSFLVVMWLLIAQRLQPSASLETAVLELLRGLPPSFWPQPCQRVRDWRDGRKSLSSHTGAYNNARQALPLTVVQQSCDRIFEQLTAHLDGTLPALGVRAFFVDGTTVRMAHSPALCESYPPGSNQHGEAHWPQLRMLVAHDLQTGLALRPEWGPVHGPQAVSEQQLVETAMDRLPKGAALVGDANFGVFSVAYAAAQREHPVVLRLTRVRAVHLAGGPLQDGLDRPIVWKPTREDRRSHPRLPADACVRGRLIVRQVQPSNGAAAFLLCLFTTLSADQDEVLNLYGQRWNIETDLRSLKSTLQLEQLSCTTSEMVAKELNLAMAAYNLVRAITCVAAERAGIPPRGYSFTRVRNVVEAFTPLVANAKTPQEAQKYFDQMMYYVGQAKLPKRTKRRPSYPRTVWGMPKSFPHRRR
jgi:putative transposase